MKMKVSRDGIVIGAGILFALMMAAGTLILVAIIVPFIWAILGPAGKWAFAGAALMGTGFVGLSLVEELL